MLLLPCTGFLCGRIYGTGSTASRDTLCRTARIERLPLPDESFVNDLVGILCPRELDNDR